MAERRSKQASAPVITCDAKLARFLGAAPLAIGADLERFGEAAIPIVADDGTKMLWPLERDFVAAIERRR